VPEAPRRVATAVGLGCLVWLVVGCTERDPGGSESESSVPEAGDTAGRPDLELPGGSAPDDLDVEDLVEGDGAEVADDTVLTLHYIGATWSGSEVASSWERGQPLIYRYGDGRWVEGWTRGLDGMREGGRRQIVVPPELGYGNRSVPGVPAGETLVFVVDLLEVE
jgi:FKBP-type peptidyl-prolyl cis-trans isomerase